MICCWLNPRLVEPVAAESWTQRTNYKLRADFRLYRGLAPLTSFFLFLHRLPGSSEPKVNSNNPFIIASVKTYMELLFLVKYRESTGGFRLLLGKEWFLASLSPVLWMLALEGESPAFPMEHNPSPLSLLALERRWLIFISGRDKGCSCPR